MRIPKIVSKYIARGSKTIAHTVIWPKMRQGLNQDEEWKSYGPRLYPGGSLEVFRGKRIRVVSELFNVIHKITKTPHKWRIDRMISFYKNKGDIKNCNNDRGVKLLRHTIKF